MLIDGKKISEEIQNKLRSEIEKISGRKPCLAVIIVGNVPASTLYVKRKMEACAHCGIRSLRIELPETVNEKTLIAEIQKLNHSPDVDGILVQLPLPAHINPLRVNEHIAPSKDVDGLHPMNMGKLLMGQKEGFIPCTPLGIQHLIEAAGVEIEGKHAVILGRSLIVGKPMAALLLNCNATVTVLHSKSQNISAICKNADILVAAIGKPAFITKEMVKSDAIVIDVGINRIEDPSRPGKFRIVGDADFESLKDYCRAITPVPGGVGPMTITMLLSNTLKSFYSSKNK